MPQIPNSWQIDEEGLQVSGWPGWKANRCAFIYSAQAWMAPLDQLEAAING